MTQKSDDSELVKHAARGDREAFRMLVEKYQARLLLLAQEIVRSREEAEDVVQESFVKAFLSLKEFKGESSFFTWMYRVTYNMAIDFKRKATRRGGDAVAFDESTSDPEAHPPASRFMGTLEGPEDVVTRQEQNQRLNQALSQMSEEHRGVVILREIDGLSYEEISKITGVSQGTVMSRLHYARKKLQSLLQDLAPVVRQTGSSEAGSRNKGDPGGPHREGRIVDSEGRAVSGRGVEVNLPGRGAAHKDSVDAPKACAVRGI